jgi:hypothetical protein
MNVNDVFEQTKDAYLCLIHPIRRDDIYRREIAPVLAIVPAVPDQLVASMIVGASWRERLLGLCLSIAKRQAKFVNPMLESLRDPRGISIVPACAALAVLANRGIFEMSKSFSEMFDRRVFDGEIGWATDKAMYFAGLRTEDVPGKGPNYGQNFDDHTELYSWIYSI